MATGLETIKDRQLNARTSILFLTSRSNAGSQLATELVGHD